MVKLNQVVDIEEIKIDTPFLYNFFQHKGEFVESVIANLCRVDNYEFPDYVAYIYVFRMIDPSGRDYGYFSEQVAILEHRISKGHFFNLSFESEAEEARFKLLT